MVRKPDNVTVVILSEQDAKEVSVRYALRCIARDCRWLIAALVAHYRRYSSTYVRGHDYKNHWWIQHKR